MGGSGTNATIVQIDWHDEQIAASTPRDQLARIREARDVRGNGCVEAAIESGMNSIAPATDSRWSSPVR